jgi:hypothetical protein
MTPSAIYPLAQHRTGTSTIPLQKPKNSQTLPNFHTGATYLYVSMRQVLQKLTVPQPVTKHPTFYETHQGSILILEDSF